MHIQTPVDVHLREVVNEMDVQMGNDELTCHGPVLDLPRNTPHSGSDTMRFTSKNKHS